MHHTPTALRTPTVLTSHSQTSPHLPCAPPFESDAPPGFEHCLLAERGTFFSLYLVGYQIRTTGCDQNFVSSGKLARPARTRFFSLKRSRFSEEKSARPVRTFLIRVFRAHLSRAPPFESKNIPEASSLPGYF